MISFVTVVFSWVLLRKEMPKLETFSLSAYVGNQQDERANQWMANYEYAGATVNHSRCSRRKDLVTTRSVARKSSIMDRMPVFPLEVS